MIQRDDVPGTREAEAHRPEETHKLWLSYFALPSIAQQEIAWTHNKSCDSPTRISFHLRPDRSARTDSFRTQQLFGELYQHFREAQLRIVAAVKGERDRVRVGRVHAPPSGPDDGEARR